MLKTIYHTIIKTIIKTSPSLVNPHPHPQSFPALGHGDTKRPNTYARSVMIHSYLLQGFLDICPCFLWRYCDTTRSWPFFQVCQQVGLHALVNERTIRHCLTLVTRPSYLITVTNEVYPTLWEFFLWTHHHKKYTCSSLDSACREPDTRNRPSLGHPMALGWITLRHTASNCEDTCTRKFANLVVT